MIDRLHAEWPAPLGRWAIGGSWLMLILVWPRGPVTGTEPSRDLLQVVRGFADAMLERGRDTYGPEKSGLFLSALDRTTLAPLTSRSAPPGGIRREDRSGEPWSPLVGANLHLDENLLRIMYLLSAITGEAKYAAAADEELRWFFEHALSPATGLAAWGEHMSWQVLDDRPISGGNDAIHEFARPWLLWNRSFAVAPAPCRQFAKGLWEHQIADHTTGGFDRHAPYFQHGPVDGKDFARHAGFYIATWAYAFHYTQDETFLNAIDVLLSRFERKRIQKDGAEVATIGPLDCHIAAALVSAPLAARLRTFAEREDDLMLADLTRRDAPDARLAAAMPPLWRNGYSSGVRASTAMFCLARYEQVPKQHLRDTVIAIADEYQGAVPDEDLDVWPMAFGHAISTQAAAYRWTAKDAYRDEAQRLAQLAVALFWQDNPLPRASLKSGHYESITGADSLALALLEVYAFDHALPVGLPSNSIDR